MAKRKRKPAEGGGPKLRAFKDYRDDQYVFYIFQVEAGILEAWTIEPDLRDGDVREALRGLIRTMKRTGELPPALWSETPEETSEETSEAPNLLEWRLLSNLRQAFEKHGPLDVADTIGILTVINNSVGAWNRGMRGQEYLKYIREFLGGMGVTVREISETEAKTMLLEPAEDDDSPPPPKKKFLGLF
jgi:hypothetical protein